MVVHHSGRRRAAGQQAHDIFVGDLWRVLPDLLRLVDGAGGAERLVAAGIVCAGKPKHVRIAHGSAESALPKVVSKQTNNAGSAIGVHCQPVRSLGRQKIARHTVSIPRQSDDQLAGRNPVGLVLPDPFHHTL